MSELVGTSHQRGKDLRGDPHAQARDRRGVVPTAALQELGDARLARRSRTERFSAHLRQPRAAAQHAESEQQPASLPLPETAPALWESVRAKSYPPAVLRTAGSHLRRKPASSRSSDHLRFTLTERRPTTRLQMRAQHQRDPVQTG